MGDESRGTWALVFIVAAAVVMGGCSSGQEEPPSAAESTPTVPEPEGTGAVDRSREFPATVTVEGTGAAAFHWEGTQTINFIRVGRADLKVNLLSASVDNPERLPEDPAARFRWGFDLQKVYEDHPGVFTFDGRTGERARSGVPFVWMRVTDSAAHKPSTFDEGELVFLKRFTVLQEPCTVDIGAGEHTGTLRCPAVATEDGETAGFTVTWVEQDATPQA